MLRSTRSYAHATGWISSRLHRIASSTLPSAHTFYTSTLSASPLVRLQPTLVTSQPAAASQHYDVNTHRAINGSFTAINSTADYGSHPSPFQPSQPSPYEPLPAPAVVSPADFRLAFRSAASSVWVVTSSLGCEPVGFTAISIASVSVSPPMLSFNISKTSSSLSILSSSRHFAVHLLDSADASIDIAKRFAAKPTRARFDDQRSWSWDDRRLPNIRGAITRLSGKIVQLVEAGDSWLAVGLVEKVEHNTGTPLLHCSGTYRLLLPYIPAAPTTSSLPASSCPSPVVHSRHSSSTPTTTGAKGINGSTSASSSSRKRRMYLNAFDMSCVGHQSPGVWTHPLDQSHRYKELSYWTELAQLLDRGGFDTLFLADVLGTYDVYRGNRDAAVLHGAQVPVNEPTLAIPAMAAVTNRLGFAVTVSLTYEQPYAFARRMSTLDHLTEGRVAWNIVTSYLQSAAVNLGLDHQIPHDERYNVAEEYMQVCYKLWEASWEEDAVIRDKKQRVFALPHKVHDVNHNGKYYKVPGVHLCEPSPQRTPVLFQAGASSKGQVFAARHAEGVFVISVNTRHLRTLTKAIRQQAAEQGRDPASVKIFALLTPIVDITDEKAQAKFVEYKLHASEEGALALYGGWTGIDLSTAPPDAPLQYVENDSLRSVGEMFRRSDPSKQWTARQVAEFLGIGGIGPILVGSPTTVADELERWMEEGDVDGFNLAYAITPGTFVDFVHLVVPELRRRGLLAPDEDGDGGVMVRKRTLRERLWGHSARLPEDHPGAHYRRVLEEKRREREKEGVHALPEGVKAEL